MVEPEDAERLAVHPRACGELCSNRGSPGHEIGSSPRMRGTLCFPVPCTHYRAVHPRACGELPKNALGVAQEKRFIPAHAGNSPSLAGSWMTSAVHPRACGELEMWAALAGKPRGSSPRMRGTPSTRTWHRHRYRFIPAHAGNSSGVRAAMRSPTVHPRACGELQVTDLLEDARDGSSPRMRGTPVEIQAEQIVHRFIPAHAGNSQSF